MNKRKARLSELRLKALLNAYQFLLNEFENIKEETLSSDYEKLDNAFTEIITVETTYRANILK